MQSIPRPQIEYNATGAALDHQAAERGQERADAADGWAYYNALTLKWMQQGYTAAELGTAKIEDSGRSVSVVSSAALV